MWLLIHAVTVFIGTVGINDEERQRAQKERADLVSRGKSALKELVIHLLFLWIVVSLSYGTNDSNSYYVYRTISNTFFVGFETRVSFFTC